MIKAKVGFLEGRLFPVNQGFLKQTFQIALIGWIKPLLVRSCKQTNCALFKDTTTRRGR